MAAKKHILTVSVEDYFHVGAFEGAILQKHWERFEPRLEHNISEVLQLLKQHDIRATFFVLGCVADHHPQIVRRIVDGGHEVASSGYWPRGLKGMLVDEFREDLKRAKDALERTGSNPIIGYRSSRNWLKEGDQWVLDVLAEEGYLYDSSINPVLRRFARDSRRFEVHQYRHSASGLTIWEFPISTMGVLGLRLAISGGNYVRQFPHSLLSRAVERWHRRKDAPLVFYFMPWEMDREQPHITNISTLTKVRHYRNLAKTRWVFEYYFEKYEFQSIREFLGIEQQRGEIDDVPGIEIDTARPPDVEEDVPETEKEPVTVVVPLFNEKQTVPYLQRTVLGLRRRLERKYRVFLLLVDDGSSDGTWESLNERFRDVTDCKLVRHPKNVGVNAAILTGIRNAPTEIVCSIDCDCSYDPNELEQMIPLIGTADIVTASPYHPRGSVYNVPGWRLFLSKTLSRLYSLVLRDRIYTYTSCFRVYRKSAVEKVNPSNGGFLGIAETLILMKLRGATAREFPATLESRILGESKMKVVRTIRSHLGLLFRLAFRSSRRHPTGTAGSPQRVEAADRASTGGAE